MTKRNRYFLTAVCLGLAALARGARALRVLRAAVPAIDAWTSAVRDRSVVLANPRSFCAGVERAIDIVDRALDRFGAPVYVRRQIVELVGACHRTRRLGRSRVRHGR